MVTRCPCSPHVVDETLFLVSFDNCQVSTLCSAKILSPATTELCGGDPLPLLTNVLLYHVAPMIMSLTQVVDGEDIATLFSDASIQPDARKLV